MRIKTKPAFIFIAAFCLLFPALLNAQEKRITIDVREVSLEQLFMIIEKQTDYKFSYRNSIIDNTNDITLKAENESVEVILNRVLPAKGLSFKVASDYSIAITKTEPAEQVTRSSPVKLSGRVTDENGEAIIGANVRIDGTSTGTATDIDGSFTLEAAANGSVTVSFIGYIPQKKEINGSSFLDIVLEEDVEALGEIVVIGYGTQRKVNLTGAVAMVSSDEMTSRPLSDLSTGLQGMLTGVTVVNSTGQPGASSSTIRIRGLGTIGNSDPLILIDGVEGDMSTLNPEDVESVSVLKDAASASIYGARAANGVILVTTRKLNTKDQDPTITINAYYGIQTPTRLPEMCDAVEFMTLDNEARTNVGSGIAWNDTHFEKVTTGSDPNNFGNTNWLGEVLNSYAPQKSYSVNVNGNLGKSGYLMSYRNFDQDGLTVGNSTGEMRHNFRLKVDSYLLDRVHLTTNMGYTVRNVVSPIGSLTSGGGAIYTAMRIAPNVPVRYTDGSWAYGGGNTNPVAILYDGGYTKYDYDEMSLMGIAKIDILKGWDISATYSIVNGNSLKGILKKSIVFTNPDYPDTPVYTFNNPNSLSNTDVRQRQQTLIMQSNFDFTKGEHNISGVAGFSQEWMVGREFEASRTDLITEDDPTLNLGSAEAMSNTANASQWAIRSGFGRVNYNFMERYLLEVNLRYDLSSRFYKSNRGGLFPSFSGAWRLSEEPFMKFTRQLFNIIKVRGSWGMLGNQYVGSTDYPYLSVLNEVTGLSTIGTLATTGYTQTTLANPLLTWEKINMLDFGLDLALLQNRLELTFDWYNKNTNGMLLQLNYPSQIGASVSEQNVGSLNNKGWEINIAWRESLGKLSYGLSLNLSDVKNKITDLGETSADLSSYQIREVGYPIDAFYGYIAEGLMIPDDFGYYDESDESYSLEQVPVVVGNDYEPGDIKYRDISGPLGEPDGKISPEYDRVVLGSAIPRYTYSLNGHLGYKNIDFSFSLQGVGKANGYLRGSARHAFQDMAAYPQKIHLERYNVETNPDPDASYPRLTYNVGFNQSTFSTFWMENASYLRLKNIQIGYTLPTTFTRKARIESCRIYVSADNLLTFTDFFYAYDPETPISSGGYYPQVKTCVMGISITFK